MIRTARQIASLPGDLVVFLIGMRINKPLHVHRWQALARPRTLGDSGLLS
jgi:hypothetical protein